MSRIILTVLLLCVPSLASAKIIQNIDWPREVWARAFPVLSCGFDAVVICEKDRPICSTKSDFFLSLFSEVNLKNETITIGETTKGFKIERATIQEGGFGGTIRGMWGTAGIELNFFYPADPTKPINISQTIDTDDNFRQIFFGSCVVGK